MLCILKAERDADLCYEIVSSAEADGGFYLLVFSILPVTLLLVSTDI